MISFELLLNVSDATETWNNCNDCTKNIYFNKYVKISLLTICVILFYNRHDVLPIVMGAAPQDYKRVAPLHSYIHVEEFSSPRELADFLHLLDRRDDLYNTYFSWKGTGTFINTHFWCRVCALLHDEERPVNEYKRLGDWWSGEGVCIGNGRWDSHRREHEDTHGGLFV